MAPLLIALFAALRCTVRSRLELEAEILALRHQLAVLQRQVPRRPRLGRTDRMLWVLLSRMWPDWARAVQIVTPDGHAGHGHRRSGDRASGALAEPVRGTRDRLPAA
jgi:hypothetical protein